MHLDCSKMFDSETTNNKMEQVKEKQLLLDDESVSVIKAFTLHIVEKTPGHSDK